MCVRIVLSKNERKKTKYFFFGFCFAISTSNLYMYKNKGKQIERKSFVQTKIQFVFFTNFNETDCIHLSLIVCRPPNISNDKTEIIRSSSSLLLWSEIIILYTKWIKKKYACFDSFSTSEKNASFIAIMNNKIIEELLNSNGAGLIR